MSILLTVFLRTLFFYFFILVIIRVMGKREVGQLSPFDLVVTIMMAEASIMAIENPELPLLAGVIPIVTLMVAEVSLSYFSMKSLVVRLLVTGRPNMVIKDGKILEEELRRIRYNVHDLLAQLRQQGITDPQQVEFALVEASGSLSVIPKAAERPVQPKDMYLQVDQASLPGAVVVDGSIDTNTLKERNWTTERLLNELRARGYDEPSEILYASLDEKGQLYIQPKARS